MKKSGAVGKSSGRRQIALICYAPVTVALQTVFINNAPYMELINLERFAGYNPWSAKAVYSSWVAAYIGHCYPRNFDNGDSIVVEIINEWTKKTCGEQVWSVATCFLAYEKKTRLWFKDRTRLVILVLLKSPFQRRGFRYYGRCPTKEKHSQ